MTQFEFVLVFISIVMALGVSHVLSGWGEQIRNRTEVRHYWLHTAWGGMYLFAAIQAWWGMWLVRDLEDWSFLDVMMAIIPYSLLALMSHILTPSVAEGHRDLRKYYFDNSSWMFGVATVFLVTLMLNTLNLRGFPPLGIGDLLRVIGIAIMVVLASWKNERFHVFAMVSAYVLMSVYISLTLTAL